MAIISNAVNPAMKGFFIMLAAHDGPETGEDGPTHEPIEQLASMRAIPGVTVIRPADAAETAVAWAVALENRTGPTVLALSRQNLSAVNDAPAKAKGLRKGAYVVRESDKVDVVIIATGSEVGTALGAADLLAAKGVMARVVSMPCTELFEAQDKAYRDSVIPPERKKRVVVEAGCTFGWCRYAGDEGLVIGMARFGASAPYKVLAEKFGFTPESVAARVEDYLKGAP